MADSASPISVSAKPERLVIVTRKTVPQGEEVADEPQLLKMWPLRIDVPYFAQKRARVLPSHVFAPLAESARRAFNTIGESLKPALQRLAENIAKPGTLIGDWVTLGDDRQAEATRMAAAERLAAQWFRKPVHGARWSLILPELRRRAEENESTVESQLQAATIQSLFLARDDVPRNTLTSDLLRVFRAKVANRVTDDLAGPHWRRRLSGTEVTEEVLDDFPDELDVQFQAELESLREAIGLMIRDLPRAQHQAVLAKLEGRPLSNAEHQAWSRLRRDPPEQLRPFFSA